MIKKYKYRTFFEKKLLFILFFVLCIVATLFCCVNKNSFELGDTFYRFQWGLHGNSKFCIENSILKANHTCIDFDDIDSKKLKSNWFINLFLNRNKEKVLEKDKVKINFEKAYSLFSNIENKKDIIVAILDSGIDISHYELKDSIWINEDEIPNNNIDDDNNGYIDDYNGYNFIENNSKIYTNNIDDIHGTHSAGIIAAKHYNGGIKGIAYDSHIKIMPLKILGENGAGKILNLINAIKYARDNGASICNISLGSYNYNKELDDLIKNTDMLFVVATGNGEEYKGYNIDNNNVWPASFNYDNVISVSNISLDGNLFESSNYGMNVSVAAPGTFILSTIPENKFGYITGTSMAAPFVTGACAVLMSSYENVNLHNIKKIIEDNCYKINTLNKKIKTSGIVDLYKAMKNAINYKD